MEIWMEMEIWENICAHVSHAIQNESQERSLIQCSLQNM